MKVEDEEDEDEELPAHAALASLEM